MHLSARQDVHGEAKTTTKTTYARRTQVQEQVHRASTSHTVSQQKPASQPHPHATRPSPLKSPVWRPSGRSCPAKRLAAHEGWGVETQRCHQAGNQSRPEDRQPRAQETPRAVAAASGTKHDTASGRGLKTQRCHETQGVGDQSRPEDRQPRAQETPRAVVAASGTKHDTARGGRRHCRPTVRQGSRKRRNYHLPRTTGQAGAPPMSRAFEKPPWRPNRTIEGSTVT